MPDTGNNTPLAERSDYFDVGVSQNLGSAWTVGVDAYYRKVQRLQDEGQFGSALVYSTFNYAAGRVKGLEFTVNYEQGPLSAYFNASLGKAIGKRIITSQYNFAPDDLAYVNNHWIFLDHDQKLTSSGGISYALNDSTRVGADYLFGSGLRKDGDVPNGASLPAYFQLNLNVSHDFTFDALRQPACPAGRAQRARPHVRAARRQRHRRRRAAVRPAARRVPESAKGFLSVATCGVTVLRGSR